jgi:predicted DNA-binding transcriptional regulator YafY
LLVSPKALRFMGDNSHLILSSTRVQDGSEIEIASVQEDWLLRTLRTYLGEITVLAPKSTEAALKDRFVRTLNRYR